MTKILTKEFWRNIDSHLWKAGIACFILTVFWGLISVGLYCFEGQRSYFEIRSILKFKLILAGVFFLVRYLMFSKYRKLAWFKWIFFSIVLIILSSESISLVKALESSVYLLLKVLDALVWGVFSAGILEVFAVLIRFWTGIKKVNPAGLEKLWKVFWDDMMQLGIVLTLLAALTYYYLSSFYLMATLFYSYLLAILLVIPGLWLFLYLYFKVTGWINEDLHSLDIEIAPYLDWNQMKADPEFYQTMLSLDYLLMVRKYLTEKCRPVFSLKAICCYIVGSGIILWLPYGLGLIVEVGSLK